MLALLAGMASAADLPPADIYILGERHDNPTHHETQARLVAQIEPAAIVFEMLTGEQADRIDPTIPRDPQVLEQLLDWSDMGWPDIAMYAPIMADPETPIVGAAGSAGDLSAYGLDEPLPPAQQAARERLQADAHCGALPENILPDFVARQREMDAQFAARTLDALDEYGGPVVLIAGNGHARNDWGVPTAIARVRPDVTVIAVVQGEEGWVPPGGDLVIDAPAPARDDPCDAFR
ncbi:MAG: ChaN family lipoprotein [Pseudomonadota bacterium]